MKTVRKGKKEKGLLHAKNPDWRPLNLTCVMENAEENN